MRILLLVLTVSAALAQERVIPSEGDVYAAEFTNGKLVTALCADGLRQWDLTSGSVRKSIRLAKDEMPLALPAGGGVFAVKNHNGVITVRDSETEKEALRIAGSFRPDFYSAAVSTDGKLVAAPIRVKGNSRNDVLHVWDEAGNERFSVPAGMGGSLPVFSPDGSMVAAASADTNLRIWATRDGELLQVIDDLLVSMFALSFTPDGRFLAAAGVDRIVYFWDTRTWKLVHKLTGQPEMINAMAFSADGRLLATGGSNDISETHPVSILLWDVASAKNVATLQVPHAVYSVAFSPDGKWLVAGSGEKSVRMWELRQYLR